MTRRADLVLRRDPYVAVSVVAAVYGQSVVALQVVDQSQLVIVKVPPHPAGRLVPKVTCHQPARVYPAKV